MSIAFMTSSSEFFIQTMSAALFVMSSAAPSAIPISAYANAGESLTPSPINIIFSP